MTHEMAMKVSAELAAQGIPHRVSVGHYENMNPPVQCSVELPVPRRYSGNLSVAIVLLEDIGRRCGVELVTNFMGEGLRYETEGTLKEQRQRLLT